MTAIESVRSTSARTWSKCLSNDRRSPISSAPTPGASWNSFASFAYDGNLVLTEAIQQALKKGKPGTPEFRKAIRDELRNVKELAGTNGIYQENSANNHTQCSRCDKE